MKTKLDFVTNSSSTAFIITNHSKYKKTLVDFVKENPQLIQEYKDEYMDPKYYDQKTIDEYSQKELLKSARQNNIVFKPDVPLECIFGDEDGTLIGRVFDYILRDGGRSESFTWRFYEYHR